MLSAILSKLASIWQRIPFRHVLALTVFLSFWGDEHWGQQYPFTNFPMYSHLDAESDVLFVTDQADKPLPFHTLFGTRSSTQKKVFISELKKLCNPKGRDTRHALPEERQAAGGKMVAKLMAKLKRDRLPPEVTTLRFHYKVFRAEGDKIAESSPVTIAEYKI
ncbi:MAG: hypothetical protein ACOYMN_16585 [Roseimicrobium sp.]